MRVPALTILIAALCVAATGALAEAEGQNEMDKVRMVPAAAAAFVLGAVSPGARLARVRGPHGDLPALGRTGVAAGAVHVAAASAPAP